jgi:hypothetical protein
VTPDRKRLSQDLVIAVLKPYRANCAGRVEHLAKK